MLDPVAGQGKEVSLPVTPLPCGARAGEATDRGGFEEISLPAEASARLRSFAAEHGLELRSLVAAAWAILLSRYTGETSVIFGIGCSQTRGAKLRHALVQVPADQPLLPWLFEVQTAVTAPHDNEPVLFETAIAFDASDATSDIPLLLRVLPDAELRVTALYQGRRFAEHALPRILANFRNLLEILPAHSHDRLCDLPLLTEAERNDLVVRRNGTDIPYRNSATIHLWIEEQAARTPEQTAVIFGGRRLSYRELEERANRLAARLRAMGAAPEAIVGICVERSLDMVVGLLGILKSGAAYLPLDPAFPAERLQFMLEDSRASIVVTQQHSKAKLPASGLHVVTIGSAADEPAPAPGPASAARGHNLAYVIYTSGSTGRPKGVMVEHRQVSNFFGAMDRVIGTQPGVWLAVTSISFDISVLELFWTLARGFTVVVLAESARLAAGAEDSIAAQIATHQVTHLQCTPSMARLLVSSPEVLASLRGLRKLMLGGEALPSGLAAQLQPVVSGEIFNLYGPTETTVWSAAHRILRDEAVVPIGRPVANTQLYILDAHLNPVPFGARGELFIGGAGVTRGYLNRPALTAEKFPPDPFRRETPHRIYRTGDLARYRPDGAIEFLGRIDNQVKILGFRIEPEEIEAALGQHPDVRTVAVVVLEAVPGDKQLIAWLVPGERSISIPELRAFARNRLPAHMVPAGFVIVDALPQTPNRKVDKKALAALPVPGLNHAAAASSASLEETVARIFREALELETVRAHDNFFDLGANSMVMAQIAITLQETLQREIALTDLFQYPTIASLAGHLAEIPDREAPLRRSLGRAQSRKKALLDRPNHGPSRDRRRT